MPTWVCRLCGLQMSVAPEVVGKTRACERCGQQSVVESVNTGRMSADVTQNAMVPHVNLNRIPDSDVGSWAKLFFALVPMILGLAAIYYWNVNEAHAFVLAYVAGGFLVQGIVMWPIYTMANETRENRRLLAEIARSLKR